MRQKNRKHENTTPRTREKQRQKNETENMLGLPSQRLVAIHDTACTRSFIKTYLIARNFCPEKIFTFSPLL